VLLRFCCFSFLGIICNLGFFLGFGGALDLALATACGVDFNEAGVEFMMH
jgi:oligosaccharyltransferase complex subunit beta